MSTSYPTIDVSRTPPIPFSRTVQVELRKAFDTRASFWLFVAIAVLGIIIEGFFLLVGLLATNVDLSFTAFTGPIAYVLQPAVAVLTIMLLTSEWGQRTAMVTFALDPRRGRVVWAKFVAALLLAAALVVLVLVIALICSVLVDVAHPDNFEWDFNVGQILGLLVLEALAVGVGFAMAMLILNTPAAVAAFPVVVYVIPLGLGFVGLFWAGFRGFSRYLNFQTGQSPLADWSLDTGAEWGHLLVNLILWVIVPLVLGQVRISRAEVK